MPMQSVFPRVNFSPNLSSGWFARDPVILKKVGKILLEMPDDNSTTFGKLIIAEDCFNLLSIPPHQLKDILTSSVEKLYGSKPISITLNVMNFPKQ